MPTPPDIARPAHSAPPAPAVPAPTFAEAWHLWLSYRALGTRPLRASTLADYESIYRRHLAPPLGALALDALDGLTIACFVIAKTAAGTSPKRLSNIIVPLRACLRWHHRMGALPSDPSPWFDSAASASDERRMLTIAEVERLVAAHPPEFRAFVAFAAYVGTRAGEQRALTWDDVDLSRQLVRIDKTLFRTTSQRSTKTGFDRTVPLPPHIALMLAEWRAHCPSSPERYVFPSRTGRPLDLDTYRARVFRPAVARAGLPPTRRFHDLRHTAASLLLQSGATVRRHGHLRLAPARYRAALPAPERHARRRRRAPLGGACGRVELRFRALSPTRRRADNFTGARCRRSHRSAAVRYFRVEAVSAPFLRYVLPKARHSPDARVTGRDQRVCGILLDWTRLWWGSRVDMRAVSAAKKVVA